MNASTFNRYSLTCPICQHAGSFQPGEIVCGLYTCPHCQSRFVISWSGHYVRDPLSLSQPFSERVIRQQSRPLARVARDLGIVRVAVIATTLALGLGWMYCEYQKSLDRASRPSVEQLR
jgi:hypothetical protein